MRLAVLVLAQLDLRMGLVPAISGPGKFHARQMQESL